MKRLFTQSKGIARLIKLVFLLPIFFAGANSFAQTVIPNTNCLSAITTSGGSSVQFLGVTYTGTGLNIKSTYTYKVTSGCSPNVSHFTFGNFDCLSCMSDASNYSSVNSGGPFVIGTDPTTGICGIKYDYSINCNGSSTVSFTLNGFYGVGLIKFALKSGGTVEYGDICGPICTSPILNLGDFVFYDTNNNGIQDAGEPGIAGATVKLYADANGDNVPDGASLATTTTSSTGIYAFTGLTAGNYIVGVTLPAGYAQGTTTLTSASPNNDNLTDNNGVTLVGTEVRSNFITLTTGGEPTNDGDGNNGNLTLDFGLRGTAVIGNFVFNDLNGNGIQDAGEPGLAGVTVTLKNAAGVIVATTTTTAGGAYSFTNLAPGTYSITFGTPTNFVASPSNQGTDDTKDSDPISGVVSGIVLTAGQTNNTVDAGFVSNQLNLGDFVFYDTNNNGIQDAGEPGIAGATVKLYADANGDNVPDGAALASATTSSTGIYAFTGLTPGNYMVGVTLPAGYAQGTTSATSASPNNDNLTDNNGVTLVGTEVRSNFITLTTGVEPTNDGDGNNGNLTLDFALKGTGSIGDFVWNDLNKNGVQDAGEVGLPGVVITLRDLNGNLVASTTSGALGQYSFLNLPPDTYSVAFATPAQYTASPSNIGDDTKDSDPVNGVVSGIVLTAGESNATVDAGFYSGINLYGNIFHDANALADNLVNSTSTVPIPSGIRAYLVDLTTGLTVDKVNVLSNGTFSFLNVAGNKDYRVVISTVSIATGLVAPPVILPSGWTNTGEKFGATSGSDGLPDGKLIFPTQTTDVYNINFGIRRTGGDVVIG